MNNSGGPLPGSILESSSEQFIDAFNRHLINNHNLSILLIPGMKSDSFGRIINIVSLSVKQPIPDLGVSNTIRGAVASWAKTLSYEVASYGITVNNILPGFTNTERLKNLIKNIAVKHKRSIIDVTKEMESSIPANRFAEPTETANAVAFLASDSSKIKLNTIQAIYSPVHAEHLAYIGTQFPMYYFDTQIVGNDSWRNLDILNQSNIGPHMEGLHIISNNYSIDIKNQIYDQAFDCTQLIYSIINHEDNGRLALVKRLSNLSDFNGESHNIRFVDSNLNTSLQVLKYDNNQISRTGYFIGDSLLSVENIAP